MIARGGFSFLSRIEKASSAVRGPSSSDEHALGGIRNPAFELQLGCESINEWAKTDALDGAAHDDLQALAIHGEPFRLTKQAVNKTDLIEEEQTKNQTEHAGCSAHVTVKKAKSIC